MARAVDSPCRVGTTRRLVSGRVRELGALQAERQRSVQGELRMALVLGDAGSGKTRLAAELLPRDDESTIGLVVHNSPFGAMSPFGPWADTLGLHADDLGADRVCRACGSGLGGLPALVPRTAHDASSCAQALRYHLVEWIPALLTKVSADRPVTVIIDDAHQGHDAVWEMLLRLAWEAPDSRLFVHVTARPAELAGHRIAINVLHALEQEALVHRLQLAPFSREDVRELAAEIFQQDCVPSALVDWLMARAQGNPRFVLGLLEALVDNGTDLQTPALDGVPEKLARWVRTEVTRLDQPAVALVELLTVAGDLVDSGELARITSQPIEDVALTLERLVRCGMLVEQRHGQSLGYRLVHPLTREVLYTDMGGARRRVTHRRVAATLLESGRTEAAAPHLARAAQAGDGEAIDALIEMVQRAAQQGLCSQVWTTVSTLRDLLPIGDERWLGIAEALGVLGHTLGWQGRFDAAEDVLVRSVELATAAARLSWMSQSLALLAALDACRGHLVSARTRWAQAAASSPHDDPMIGRCGEFIELLAGDLAMAGAQARQAQGHDPAARSLPVRLAGQAAMAAAERGCLAEARRHVHAMTRTDSRTLGSLEPSYWWAEGTLARAEGRLAAAAAALHRAVDCYSAMNARALSGFVLVDLAEVTVLAGDVDAAASAAACAADNARCTGAPLHETLHLLAATWALIGRGCHAQAARTALRAVDGFSSRGYVLLAARARVAYATAVQRSDRSAAEEALREAAAAFDACGAVVRREQARTLLIELRTDGPGTTEAQPGSSLPTQGLPTQGSPTRGSLTSRERQVAELAAGGYTAPQIATRLHIGVRTVESHLARSYPKLGVTSKQQLVHRAAELGFTPDP